MRLTRQGVRDLDMGRNGRRRDNGPSCRHNFQHHANGCDTCSFWDYDYDHPRDGRHLYRCSFMLIRLTPPRTIASMVDMEATNMTQNSKRYEVMRHNGQCFYGGWTADHLLNGRIYEEDDGSGEGEIDVAGNMWAYRLIGDAKSDVTSWATVATYVSTYPSDDGDGACDVEVQIGEAGGRWYLRTADDAGGSDDADDTAYDSREAAETAAAEFAAAGDEGDGNETAEGYLTRQAEIRVGDEDPSGEWSCYWSTVGDGSHVEARYATAEQAQAAAAIANDKFHAANPSGGGVTLLCGYEVRQLVDGEWVASDDEA